MASSTTVTLSDLIEEALSRLHPATERPAEVALAADALASTSDTTITLTGDYAAVRPSTLLEVGQELLLVTGRDTSTPPVFTVARGYAGTPKAAAVTGTVVRISPLWTRYEVYRAILRCFAGPLTAYLPCLTSTTITVTANTYFLSMPAACIDVMRVGVSSIPGSSISKWDEVPQWEFIEDVPVAVVATGKMLTFPPMLAQGQTLHVTYQTAYAWSGGTATPAEAETITLPAAAMDLPSLYASSWMVMGREVSRLELDRVEEWNKDAAIRQGVNLRLATTLWGEFYRRLDEARKVQNVPQRRVYRKMGTLTNGRYIGGSSVRRRRV